MRVLLENTTFPLLELRVLLELRGLFEGGLYMRKYGRLKLVKYIPYSQEQKHVSISETPHVTNRDLFH